MSLNRLIFPGSILTQKDLIENLQIKVQDKIVKKVNTGNFLIDSVIHLFILSIVSYGFSSTNESIIYFSKYFINQCFWSLGQTCRLLKTGYNRLLSSKAIIKETRTITVPYISDNRKISELYKAVIWYLSVHKEINEDYSNMQYVYEEQITESNRQTIEDGIVIQKLPVSGSKKEITFKSYKIKYEIHTEIITIYTDREKKRENHVIKLWTEVEKDFSEDILEQFCTMCISKQLESLTNSIWSQQIYINKGGRWSNKPSDNHRQIKSVILQNSIKENIIDDIQGFLDSKDWYKTLDVPFTRGYLFYGHPGTGKTSLIRALSLYFKRHIHFLMLQNVTNDEELMELLGSINYESTFLVIEDIDATISAVKSRELDEKKDDKEEEIEKEEKNENVNNPSYKKRENQEVEEVKSQVTLSGILNALDGMVSCEGRIMFLTTNHPEVLDDALIRPGRCDEKHQFDFCNKKQIIHLYNLFFNKDVPMDQLNSIKACNYSPAHITGIFTKYRNDPDNALLHLDDTDQKIIITNNKN